MDSRLLKIYNDELFYIREMGKLFAESNPGVASHLDLGKDTCADPYVERLLEGFAFLTARVQLQYQEEYPSFTQHLLEIIYPGYLSPTPSMTIIEFDADEEGALSIEGAEIKKQSKMLTPEIPERKTHCEYRTAHNIKLWPIKVEEAQYIVAGDLDKSITKAVQSDIVANTKSAIHIKLKTTVAEKFNQFTEMDEIVFYINGSENIPGNLYEKLLANCLGIVAQAPSKSLTHSFKNEHIEPMGFEDENALLPTKNSSFQGYRILKEYFSFSERFMFIKLSKLKYIFSQFDTNEIDLYFMLDEINHSLTNKVDKSNFKLHCTPAINLFERTADRVHLTKDVRKKVVEKKSLSHYMPGHPVIVDKTKSRNYEVHSIQHVSGVGSFEKGSQDFQPFYSLNNETINNKKQRFYTQTRKPELKSAHTKEKYNAHDVYISLSDERTDLPYSGDVNELSVKVMCTNRGLPLFLGSQRISLNVIGQSLPLKADGVKNITRFTPPQPAHSYGEHSWRLISQLSLNYLSLADKGNDKENVNTLKEMLRLHIPAFTPSDSGRSKYIIENQISRGIHNLETEQIVKQLIIEGRAAFARGLQITVTLEEEAFEGGSAFLFGAVLEQFFAKYVSINSFTQTIIKTIEREEIMKWPIRTGKSPIL